MTMINTFDIDGVIDMGYYSGVRPCYDDVIITGRSIEEYAETRELMKELSIINQIFMNPIPISEKTRVTSGIHKANVISLLQTGFDIGIHFEDDPIQAEEIRKVHPNLNIVMLQHELTEK